MALKHLVCLITATLAGWSCGRPVPAPAGDAEPEPLSVTTWTATTELFAEYPVLVQGTTSRFAVHLTRLDSFEPLTEGRVEILLRGAATTDTFVADRPSRPGIFGVDVTPSGAGPRELVFVVHAPGLEDEHRIGQVQVYTTAAAVPAASPEDGAEPGISFLKEQQWVLDFGTAVVASQSVRRSVRVPGRIEPTPSGAADLAAPIDGRLVRVAGATPGTSVTRGQELARLLPPPTAPADRPERERGVTEARSALTLATRDRERAERLTAAGAAPARRLEEARATEDQARARLAAAEARLAQHDEARGGAIADTEMAFVVRAPFDGVVTRRDAATGASVTAGTILFQIVDTSVVHVVGQIPETETTTAIRSTAAEVEVARVAERQRAGPLVSVGRALDPRSRTLPITFAFDNRESRLPVGQLVFLHLLTEPTDPGPVVPASALVDEAGRPIVFVQRDGETFERRPVTVGVRAGDLAQITAGIEPGERVVTRGAYLIRLASLSTSVPAHGHVH